ncbi:hypothetical protein NLG97_g1181 [Lecanicillium saksenae]|uniref:Uncharacterized protein n=1 Tax=Lecanicillium saksenae TaxID=468837 RepID=A0ACC1R5W3_9HYPO|nr:hypothetical protein NLG97_g1181 [Lecanicillium saksenae]
MSSSTYADYLDGIRRGQAYNYGAVAIYAVTVVASFVMCIIALVKLRSHGDMARKFIRWHLTSFILFTIYMGLAVLTFSLFVAWSALILNDRFSSSPRILAISGDYVSFVTSSTGTLVHILVFLTLANLGFGIMSMRDSGTTNAVAPGSKRGGIYNARFGAYALGALVGCLQIAVFALRCKIETDGWRSSDSYSWITLGTHLNRLVFVVYFLLLLTAAGLVCWSGMTLITAKKHAQQSKTPAVFFLVCSFLFFLARLYIIAMFGAHTSLQNAALSTSYGYYTTVLDPILSAWPIFVILVLLFALGRKQRERGGLWTIPPPLPSGMQPQQQFYGYLPPQQQQPVMYVNNGYTPQYGGQPQEVKPYPQYATYPTTAHPPQQLGPNLSPVPHQLGPNLSPMAQHATPIQQQPQQQETWQPVPTSPHHQHADVRVASPSLTTPSATSPAPQEVGDNRPANPA